MQLRFVCVLVILAFACSEKQEGAKDALDRALKSIGDRIENTGAQDTKIQDQIQANCTRDLEALSQGIARKKEQIEKKEAQIRATETRIEQLNADIDVNRAQFQHAEQTKGRKQTEIEKGDAQRAAEKAEYTQFDEDTAVAIEAVIQVQEIVRESGLSAGEDETAADYKNHTLRKTNDEDYTNAGLEAPALLATKTSRLLNKLSARVSDPNVKSFIEMAALSASALQGDVTQLSTLLADLLQELKSYKKTLLEQETQAAADWRRERAALVNDIKILDAEMAKLDKEVAELRRQEKEAQANLKEQQNDLKVLQKELRDIQAQREALNKMCQDEKKEFLERSERRAEEMKTLDAIKKVIAEKLNTMHSNTNAGTGYTNVDGYRWTLGGWDNVPCINRIQTRPAYCVDIKTGAPQDNTILCGPAPQSIRRSCRVNTPKNDY